MANLFERLGKERTAPVKTKIHKDDPAQQLLNWLQTWPQPTVYTRDILIFGPYIVRNRKSAIDATETLVRHGWLIPQKTKQSNWRQWEIVRKPVIRPKVAD
jgi:hypothetical protein